MLIDQPENQYPFGNRPEYISRKIKTVISKVLYLLDTSKNIRRALLMKPSTILLSFVLFLSANTIYAKTYLCLGDSLTEGYGLKTEEAWPALIQTTLKAKDPSVKFINAGISGATSASGPSRMKWHLKNLKKEPVHVLILALGANDALRGLNVEAMRANLTSTIELALSSKLDVILVGMRAPPSLGSEYAKKFDAVFPLIAKEKKVPLVPFLLEGVAADPKLNLADGIHPNAAGHQILAKTIGKYL
jgi:acyl-CoA thioesterase-1